MSDLSVCPACGERLLSDARHLDSAVRCPACRHEFVLRREERVAPPRPGEAGLLPGERGGPRRRSVPAPRARADDFDTTLILVLATVGLLMAFVAPFAWWLAARAASRRRAAGREVPRMLVTARRLAIAGTVILAIVAFFAAAALLVL